jgi:hypothetical protein
MSLKQQVREEMIRSLQAQLPKHDPMEVRVTVELAIHQVDMAADRLINSTNAAPKGMECEYMMIMLQLMEARVKTLLSNTREFIIDLAAQQGIKP